MSFGWHPREHRKALDGMLSLTLEERGAYNTCLDLIYDREGPIPDDARWLAGWMGVSARRWATLRASLIEKGKLFETEVCGAACLMNRRAVIEIENQSKISRKLRENGAKGGRKSAETRASPNEFNDMGEAPASAPLKLITRTITVDSEANASGGEPPNPNKKAWAEVVPLLVGQGRMSAEGARAFFGKLLSSNGLEASDMLGAIGEAQANFTSDPAGWLTKAAKSRARRRSGPPKRVGFV